MDRLFKHLQLVLVKILEDLPCLQVGLLDDFDGAGDLRFFVLAELDLPESPRSEQLQQVVVVGKSVHKLEGTLLLEREEVLGLLLTLPHGHTPLTLHQLEGAIDVQ